MRLLISTGEVSGDLQGSFLIKALKEEAARRSLPLEMIAIGGPRMKAAGAELIADTAPIGAIGLLEVIPHFLPTLKVQNQVDQFLKQNPPNAVVLIDYMGPNIRLGNKLKKTKPNIPIIYYIAPQEWAWRLGDGGTTDLISFTDKILAIFKDEADFYRERGGDVTWVGHPMIDTYKALPTRTRALEKLEINSNQKVLLLFPASRTQEITYLMPILAKAASLLQKKDPSIIVLVPAGLSKFEESINQSLISAGVIGRVIPADQTDELKPFLFSAAELALSKSGTVNMELALNKVPQIVGYKVSKLTAFIARKILHFNVDHISPVNLLLKERLVPELVQEEFTPEALAEIASHFLQQSERLSLVLDGYERLRKVLGDPGVTERAAKEILDLAQK